MGQKTALRRIKQCLRPSPLPKKSTWSPPLWSVSALRRNAEYRDPFLGTGWNQSVHCWPSILTQFTQALGPADIFTAYQVVFSGGNSCTLCLLASYFEVGLYTFTYPRKEGVPGSWISACGLLQGSESGSSLKTTLLAQSKESKKREKEETTKQKKKGERKKNRKLHPILFRKLPETPYHKQLIREN